MSNADKVKETLRELADNMQRHEREMAEEAARKAAEAEAARRRLH
jgi:hypothetical protein